MPAEHDPGVAELEADQQHRQRDLPRLAGEGDRREDDRLDQGAPDDDDLAAVLVGPGAPQRDERHPDDEDQGAEDPDEREPLAVRDAHLAEVGRQQREDLADAEALDHRGDPEDRDEDPPVLAGRAGAGAGSRIGVAVADTFPSLADGGRGCPGHTKAPEGTDGDLRSTGPEAANKSAVPGRRRVPRSPALRPANLVPGTVPRITPRTGLAVQPAPSGKTKCTAGAPGATTGLSTNCATRVPEVIPELWGDVDGLWIHSPGRCRMASFARPTDRRAGRLGASVR